MSIGRQRISLDISAHQRGFGLGEALHLGAGDGFVGRDVHIGGAGGVGQRVIVRHGGRNVLGGVGEHVDAAEFFGLFDGFGGPGAGVDIVGGLARAEEVHRHHGKLHAGAALQEEHW
jgi:hypothetical protein